MYVLIAGGGKVGRTLAHELLKMHHEVTVIEQSAHRYRLLDPARAEFYRSRGMRTVCPTSTAIDVLTEAVRACEIRPREHVS